MSEEMEKCDNGFRFANWDHTQICCPDNYCQPRTEAEIVEIVQDTYKRGGVVRAFGARHSWSPLVPTDDTLINLDKVYRAVSIDKGQMRASVQAGIRIKDLVTLLRSHGLGMRNLGSIAEQSIAGAISTGTHGTGIGLGNLSTQITAMNLVTGRGEVHSISEERDTELMSAARVSLGALGVISQVTIQCVQDYNLEYTAVHLPFDVVLDQLNHFVQENDRVRLYWLTLIPDDFKVMTMNCTDKAVTQNELSDLFTGYTVNKGIVQSLSANTYDLHSWAGLGIHIDVPNKRQSVARLTWLDCNEVRPYDQALLVPIMPPHHQESEYAIPVEDAANAVKAIRGFIDEKQFLDPILVEVRFVAKDDIMLSPAYKRDVCYVGGYIFGKSNATYFFDGFESIMKHFQGRPHWGKHLTLSASEAREMYPAGFERFNEIRKELDPRGVFANDFIRNLFG
jgi:FAD-linked oxidoreductase